MITGTTRLFAIIADPISQVRTPQVFNTYFARHGMDAVLVPVHVAPQGLEAAMRSFRHMQNLGGFIVTVPHKTAIADLCDSLGPAAMAIGAVNTVRREADGSLVGDMFDGAGFVRGLRKQGIDPAGQRTLLVGSGGAASAIAHALVDAHAVLTIANRTRAKAQAIVGRVQQAFPDANVQVGQSDPADYDLVINATSLGMRPDDPLPFDTSRLSARTVVAEIIMKPEMTPLLNQARARGCPIHLGCHMLDEQAALMAQFMLGRG